MQKLQQLSNAVTARFHEASPRARITVGICVMLVLFSAFSLVFRNTPTQLEPLLNRREFSNAEVMELSQHFTNAGLKGWKLQDKKILIPTEQRLEFLVAIEGKFESDAFSSDVDSVLENGSILDNPSLREMRLRNAREKDLARIITQIPGIDEAQINIDDHQQRGLSGRKEMTALAAIKAATNTEVTLETSEAIREVIAARFAGLERNNVVVIDLNTGHTFGASDSDYNASNLDIALRNYERWWRGRIANLLIDIPNTRIEVGLYPVDVATEKTPGIAKMVNATVSVGIPDSYIQQVAESRQATSQIQRQAIAQDVKQNVTELVQGVMPVVPHTTLDEFTVHVATILDLPLNPSGDSAPVLSVFLQNAWREITMGILIAACAYGLMWRNRQLHLDRSTNRTLPIRKRNSDSHLNTKSPEDRVIISERPHQEISSDGSQKTLAVKEQTAVPHLEKPPIIQNNSTKTEAALTLKDELNALVDEAPADAADILRKWISNTSP
ncbi:MAG: hypothetical protein MK324_13435 [Pirellulales bacterium]|nr:hypothetical protein [Pirellulales bacterium]